MPISAQRTIVPEQRTWTGLEGVLREIFPIESYDKTLSLQYLKYELGKPRYGPDECRQLRLTYGRPFRVWLRLVKDQPVEEEVYLGDMDPAYSTDADILRAFYPTEGVRVTANEREHLTGRQAVGDVIDPETGEVYLE